MAMNGLTLGRNTTISIFDPNSEIVLSSDEIASFEAIPQASGRIVETFGNPIAIMNHKGWEITIDFYRKNNSTTQYWNTLEALFFGRINITKGTITVTNRDADGVRQDMYTGTISTNCQPGRADVEGVVQGTLRFLASRRHEV